MSLVALAIDFLDFLLLILTDSSMPLWLHLVLERFIIVQLHMTFVSYLPNVVFQTYKSLQPLNA